MTEAHNAKPAPGALVAHTTSLCPLDHGTDAEGKPEVRSSADGLLLCRGHLHRLEREIAEIPGLYDDLALRLHPTGPALKPYSTHNAGGVPTVNSTTGEEESATYINGRIANLRALLVSTLASWVLLVSEERGLVPARSADPHNLAGWLWRHAEWIAAQMFADEPAGHFHELTQQARALAYPREIHRFVCARCVEVTACDVDSREERRCGGDLVATIKVEEDEDGLLPAEVACRVCGQSWSSGQWMTLGRHIREAS